MVVFHQSADCAPDADRDLPRRLWRQLLLAAPIPVGAEALVIGTAPLTATERLCEFGLDVFALCDDPAAVMAGRLRCPKAEFQRFSADAAIGLPQQRFDLVLILDTDPWPSNLLSRSARLLTAQVLAAVKPGRRLLWRHESTATAPHQSGCWFRHLACFPGEIDVQSVSAPRWPLSMFRPIRRTETTVVEFATPVDPVTPLEWRRCVEKGLLTDRRNCCAGASMSVSEQRRAA